MRVLRMNRPQWDIPESNTVESPCHLLAGGSKGGDNVTTAQSLESSRKSWHHRGISHRSAQQNLGPQKGPQLLLEMLTCVCVTLLFPLLSLSLLDPDRSQLAWEPQIHLQESGLLQFPALLNRAGEKKVREVMEKPRIPALRNTRFHGFPDICPDQGLTDNSVKGQGVNSLGPAGHSASAATT